VGLRRAAQLAGGAAPPGRSARDATLQTPTVLRPILVVGNPVLRQKAKRVTAFDKNLQRLIDDMIETMRAAPGVGLAGPQIGVPLRLAVIEVDDQVTVIINPEIVKRSGEVELDEGCLSVPGFWGKLHRSEKVTVKARNRDGREFRVNAEGLLAQALQHEIDHLDGMLYIDRMPTLDDLQRSEPLRKREADARTREEEQEAQPVE
jgi:peptide deformylase